MIKFFHKNRTNLIAIMLALLLIILAVITIISDLLEQRNVWVCILTNPYVSGVIYTAAMLYIVYAIQIAEGKRMIKRDFRCNEILSDVNYSINKLNELIENKKDNQTYKNLILYNREEFSIVKQGLSYYNNDILFESLKSCLFFNLNFELLGIINNIKNRLPNITDEKKKVCMFLERDGDDTEDFDENEAICFLKDLIFLARYWKDLFSYLSYDNTYTQELLKYYNYYFEKEDFKSLEDMAVRIKMIQKMFDNEIKKKVKTRKK